MGDFEFRSSQESLWDTPATGWSAGIFRWPCRTILKKAIQRRNWAYALYQWAGIPGTMACGILSDKLFHGRRAPAVIIYMLLTTICVVVYWPNSPGNAALDIAMLIAFGFLIYGPVMLIGVSALDLVPKKAAGTATGFTGLFGYVGGSVSANVLIG